MHLINYLRSKRAADRFTAEFSLFAMNSPAPGMREALLSAMGLEDNSLRAHDESEELAA